MEKKNKKYFPFFVDLSDKKVVVVGAGTIAKRRIRGLIDFTDHLFVIAPEVNPELRELEAAGRLTILRKSYEREDIRDAWIVIAAASDHRLNQEIYADCRELGIKVNVCSDKSRCDFYFPVLAYDDSIVAGVSSAGRDSASSRRIADRIQKMLTDSALSVYSKPENGLEKEEIKEKKSPAGKQTSIKQSCKTQTGCDYAGVIRIFTDGAARGNPDGPGGYGTILQFTDASGLFHEREYSQGYLKTTNNRMELMAAIIGLEALNRSCEVELYSDSQYLINAFNQHWIENWIKKGWKRGKDEPVKNTDLWKRLLIAAEPHRISWHWVKGHDGHPENERCDRLATSAADGDDRIEDKISY